MTTPANTPKHTPGPYHRNIRAGGRYPVIFAGRNTHVCTVSQQPTGDETEANIDFIVIACNSFAANQARIAELEAAGNTLERVLGSLCHAVFDVKADRRALIDPRISEAVKSARSVLAKEGGK
jgi:acetolactate synthase regulatory subunit